MLSGLHYNKAHTILTLRYKYITIKLTINFKFMSKFLSLNSQDFIKSGFMFVASAVMTALVQMLQNQATIDPKQVFNIALIATLTYLLKQFTTDENGRIGGIL